MHIEHRHQLTGGNGLRAVDESGGAGQTPHDLLRADAAFAQRLKGQVGLPLGKPPPVRSAEQGDMAVIRCVKAQKLLEVDLSGGRSADRCPGSPR